MAESYQYKCWPFLVGNGYYASYQTIVAPQFLISAGAPHFLTSVVGTGGHETPPGEYLSRLVQAPSGDLRNITVIFRAVRATHTMLGDDGGYLTDDSGRAIIIFEGYVLQGHFQDVRVGMQAFEQVHGLLISAFRERWLTHGYTEPSVSDAAFIQREVGLQVYQVAPMKVSEGVGIRHQAANDTGNPIPSIRDLLPAMARPGSDISFLRHSYPLRIAATGDTGLGPGNIFDAILLALSWGADAILLDVQVTKDHQLVVIRSSKVDDTTDGKGKVASYNLDQLRRLDAGYRFTLDGGKSFPYRGCGITIPTLEEVMQRYPGVLFAINPGGNDWRRLNDLWALIQKHEAQQRILIFSESQRTLNRWRRLTEDAVATVASPKETKRFLRTLGRWYSRWFQPSYRVVWLDTQSDGSTLPDAELITKMHRRHVQVFVEVADEQNALSPLVMDGVDGIVTRRPDLLAVALQQQPGDLYALTERAKELYKYGLLDEALYLARNLTKRQDTTGLVCLLHMQLAQRRDFPKEALQAYKQAIELDPSIKKRYG